MVYAISILGTVKAYVLFITPYSEFQQLCKFMRIYRLLLYLILIEARKFTAIADAKSDVLADHTTIA